VPPLLEPPPSSLLHAPKPSASTQSSAAARDTPIAVLLIVDMTLTLTDRNAAARQAVRSGGAARQTRNAASLPAGGANRSRTIASGSGSAVRRRARARRTARTARPAAGVRRAVSRELRLAEAELATA